MKKASSRSHIDNGLIELTQMGNHIGLSNLIFLIGAALKSIWIHRNNP